MKVLVTIGSIRPEGGGTSVFAINLSQELARAGVTVALHTSDKSSLALEQEVGSSCLNLYSGNIETTIQDFGPPDVIHDNGIWLRSNYHAAKAAKQHACKRVVSIHGMLEPWSFDYKWQKKRLAWFLYQRRLLSTASTVHVTGEIERSNFSRLKLKVPVARIPYGIEFPDEPCKQKDCGDIRTALFLSRIHPKKGLDMLVEAWARIRPGSWKLLIVGPDELSYRSEIEQLIKRLGLSDSVSIREEIYGLEKENLLRQSHLFVLPTHSENFGMVIAESLLRGTPALTTKGAPWEDLLLTESGWWVEPTIEGIECGLRDATSSSSDRLEEMGRNGIKLIREKHGWKNLVQDYIRVYDNI